MNDQDFQRPWRKRQERNEGSRPGFRADSQRPPRRWRDGENNAAENTAFAAEEPIDPEYQAVVEALENNAGLPFSRKPRLVVFGGSFDPVHTGHIALAREIIRRDIADEVMFVPAKQSALKASGQAESAKQRLTMLELAVDDALRREASCQVTLPNGESVTREYRFSISDVELCREGDKTYTIDTMETLTRVYPDTDVKFLMGTDCLENLKQWHRYNELLLKYDFIVYPRPGAYLDMLRAGKQETAGRKSSTPNTLRQELMQLYGDLLGVKLSKAVVDFTNMPVWDISSTDIRKAVARGGDLSCYLAPSVWKYIQENNLYR
ncbi:MAG: nicotinate-nicotinamide nucleotide adenylyltransferase [Victivallales bacterium]|nr:nicotinate-nicotinamide nucleotide adenylyltransferase [Victivallales bacterium]